MLLKSIAFLYKAYTSAKQYTLKFLCLPNNISTHSLAETIFSTPTAGYTAKMCFCFFEPLKELPSLWTFVWIFIELSTPSLFCSFFSPVAPSNALTFKDLMCVWQDPVHGILFVVFLVPEHVFPNLILCFLLGTLFISIWAFPKLSTPSFPFFYWTSKKTKSWTLSYNPHLFFQLFW